MDTRALAENWTKGLGAIVVCCGPNAYALPIKQVGTQKQVLRVTFDSTGEMSSITSKLMSFHDYSHLAKDFSTDESINGLVLDLGLYCLFAKDLCSETEF